MSGLIIQEEKCIGCGKCVRACTQNGVVMADRRDSLRTRGRKAARVTDHCILCGICVDSCPTGAIEIRRGTEDVRTIDPEEWNHIWVIAQEENRQLLPVSLELVGKGRELAEQRGCRVIAVLAEGPSGEAEVESGEAEGPSGEAGKEAADSSSAALIAAGADEVIVCRSPRFQDHPSDLLAEWLCRLIRREKPEMVLFGATNLGRELAPGVAVRLQTGLTADCTELSIGPAEPEADSPTGLPLLRQTRPAFGGNLMATIICPDHRPQMATIRAGVFAVPRPDYRRQGRIREIPFDKRGEENPASRKSPADADPVFCDTLIRVLERIRGENTDAIAKAEVIVDVGRGIGSRKNLPLMEAFAGKIGAKLGCSRPLVEMGWCEYSHQIGQTGSAVAPKLLICVGISGAIQHLAGIGGAETIIAVNNDPGAPIFGVSDYAIVGDCIEIIKEVMK